MRLLVELNDQGRVGMGERVGPGSTSIEGMLNSSPDSVYSFNVLAVTYFNGVSNRWSGERLSVSKDFVRVVKERQFSRSRTFVTAAAIVGGSIAFIASRGLFGFGNTDKQPGPPDPGPQSSRLTDSVFALQLEITTDIWGVS